MPFIYGTLVSSFLALLLAVPLSIGVAVYITEMCPQRLRAIISFLVELLAAIPSVIYGLWGIFVLAPLLREYVEPFLAKTLGWTGFFSGPMYGLGMLAAGIILAIMIVPIIASITREVMTAVPQNQREAVLALGATRWEMIRMGVLRNARIGIVGGIILGLGTRAGRDHGRHHGDRQPSGDREISVCARLHHGQRYRQRIQRSHRRSVSERAGRDRIGAVPRDPDCERAGAACWCGASPAELRGSVPNLSRQSHVAGGQSLCGASPIRARRRSPSLAAILVLVPLLAIFVYLVIKGVGSINWAFLTQTPKPPGEAGGGMANAIVGTGLILAIASVIGIPWASAPASIWRSMDAIALATWFALPLTC